MSMRHASQGGGDDDVSVQVAAWPGSRGSPGRAAARVSRAISLSSSQSVLAKAQVGALAYNGRAACFVLPHAVLAVAVASAPSSWALWGVGVGAWAVACGYVLVVSGGNPMGLCELLHWKNEYMLVPKWALPYSLFGAPLAVYACVMLSFISQPLYPKSSGVCRFNATAYDASLPADGWNTPGCNLSGDSLGGTMVTGLGMTLLLTVALALEPTDETKRSLKAERESVRALHTGAAALLDRATQLDRTVHEPGFPSGSQWFIILVSWIPPVVVMEGKGYLLDNAEPVSFVIWAVAAVSWAVAVYVWQYAGAAILRLFKVNYAKIAMLGNTAPGENAMAQLPLDVNKQGGNETSAAMAWWRLRQHVLDVEAPLLYEVGGWGLVLNFLCALGISLFVVLDVWINRRGVPLSEVLEEGQYVSWIVLGFLLFVYDFATLMQAVAIYNEQHAHIQMLVRAKHAMVAGPSPPRDVGHVEDFVKESCEIMREYDPSPTLFGLSMDPNLLVALKGYVVVVLSALGTKLFTDAT